jgi:hypothetical protein
MPGAGGGIPSLPSKPGMMGPPMNMMGPQGSAQQMAGVPMQQSLPNPNTGTF